MDGRSGSFGLGQLLVSPSEISLRGIGAKHPAALYKAFAGGRPQVTVNSWQGPSPGAPVNVSSISSATLFTRTPNTSALQLNSRGFTRGTYRGNNVIYDVSIPSGVLVSGTNTIYINVLSGSSGDGFLSPNFIYDAVALWTNGGSVVTTTTTRTTTTSRTTTSTGSVELFLPTANAEVRVTPGLRLASQATLACIQTIGIAPEIQAV
ncbi:hypothetical protein FRC00_003321 [Tulasnella sp. 408]|nr:hypothetical protein FRC00_003321 [Tulasnella sp. 408]